MTVLVTGCAGFIGSHLVERLLKDGFDVIGLDSFDDFYNPKQKILNLAKVRKNKKFKLLEWDIRKNLDASPILEKNNIDKIIHLAAKAGVAPSFENPKIYFDTNVFGTLNILNFSVAHNVKQVVFGSSSSVYGLNETPFSENQALTSIVSPYAASKAAAECVCQAYSRTKNIPITILRFFTVYGARNRPDMAMYQFAEAINKKSPIYLNNKTTQRDYTHVFDIINGIDKSLKKPRDFEIINLGHNQPITLIDLVCLLQKEMGKKTIIKERPRPLWDVPITYANIDKAKEILNWKPKISLEEGIPEFVKWFNERVIW